MTTRIYEIDFRQDSENSFIFATFTPQNKRSKTTYVVSVFSFKRYIRKVYLVLLFIVAPETRRECSRLLKYSKIVAFDRNK